MDPNFGVPGRVYLLLEADVFVQTVLNGRPKGPLGSPYAIEMCFGWVLAGASRSEEEPTRGICCLSTAAGDEELRQFWEIEDCDLDQPVLSLQE